MLLHQIFKKQQMVRDVFPWLITIILAVTAALVDVLLPGPSGTSTFQAAATAGAFLLPFVINEAFVTFTQIEHQSIPAWQVSIEAEETVSIFLNSIRVTIIFPSNQINSGTSLTMVVPGSSPFGKHFNELVLSSRLLSADNLAQVNFMSTAQWHFYTKSFFGLARTQLDPKLSLRENGVVDKAVIIAEPIRKQELLTNS